MKKKEYTRPSLSLVQIYGDVLALSEGSILKSEDVRDDIFGAIGNEQGL